MSDTADLIQQANLANMEGDFTRAIACAQRAHAQALRMDRASLGMEAAICAVKIHLNQDQFEPASLWVQQALDLQGQVDDPGLAAVALMLSADIQASRGRLHDSVRGINQCLALLNDTVPAALQAQCFTGVGMLHSKFGMQIQAHAAYSQAWRVGQHDARPMMRLRLLCNLIEGLWLVLEVLRHTDPVRVAALRAEADELLLRLAEEAGQLDSVHAHSWVHYLRAGLAHARDDVPAALTHLRAAGDWRIEASPLLAVDALLLRALCEQAQGDATTCAQTLALLEPLRPVAADAVTYWDFRRLLQHAQASQNPSQMARWAGRIHALLVVHAQAMLDVQLADLSATATSQAMRAEVQLLRHRNEDLTAGHQQLTQLAHRDALTGLANRRACEAAYAAAAAGPLVLMLLDLDHFKQVNDVHGHLAGDAVLRRVAEVLLLAVRDADCVARFGGEEFVVLLPQATADVATQVATRLRALLARTDWTDLVPGRGVTVSGGWVEVRPAEPLDAALQRADAKLYAAKAAGRDRIH